MARLSRCSAVQRRDQQGQILVLFALLMVAVLGVGALALDVGLAYHQRQQQQNMATNAAVAGAYEVYGYTVSGTVPPGPMADARVLQSMKDVLSAAGYSVLPEPANGDACAAGFTSNQIYLDAIYVDRNGAPLSTAGTVGRGAFNSSARGVKVVRLGGCSQAYLAPVLGRKNFTVSADARSGQFSSGGSAGSSASTDTPIPTASGILPALASLTATPTPLPSLTSTPTVTATPTATGTATPSQSNCPTAGGDVIALATDANSNHLYMASGATVQSAALIVNGTSTNQDVLWMDGGTISGLSGAQSQVQIQTGRSGTSPITNQNNAGSINGSNGSSRNTSTYPGLSVVTSSYADPLATLAATPPSQPAAAPTPTCVGSSCSSGWNFNAGNTYYFSAGSYGSINFNSNAIFCFAPGTYYVDGTWNIDSSDRLRLNGDALCPNSSAASDPGVLLYFHSGHIQINTGGDLTHLQAEATGSYAGLLYWQAGSDDPTPDYSFSGGGFYAPNAAITFNSGATFTASYLIGKTLRINSGASITATQGGSCSSSATATPTATATVDTTTQYAISPADVMIYGQSPGPMLYAQGSTANPSGDVVTVFGNGGRWATNQYATQAQGIAGSPGGITVHDASMEGCFSRTQNAYAIGSALDFNHGGVGHCTLPTSPGVITIPVVNEIYKNDGSCPNNGGYCEVVQAIVNVDVTSISNQQITGVIVGVVADPYGLIQLPPSPTATPTDTPTATATNTPVATATPTLLPPLP